MTAATATPIPWRDYRQLPGKAAIFPSDESLRWFLRCHEKELVRAGAVIRHQNKPFILPKPFDQVVIKVGARQAKTYVAKKAEVER